MTIFSNCIQFGNGRKIHRIRAKEPTNPRAGKHTPNRRKQPHTPTPTNPPKARPKAPSHPAPTPSRAREGKTIPTPRQRWPANPSRALGNNGRAEDIHRNLYTSSIPTHYTRKDSAHILTALHGYGENIKQRAKVTHTKRENVNGSDNSNYRNSLSKTLIFQRFWGAVLWYLGGICPPSGDIWDNLEAL